MAIAVIGQYVHVAGTIVERTADILTAEVHVVDEQGVIVASSASRLTGMSLQEPTEAEKSRRVCVPLSLNGRNGRVVIEQQGAETVSPRLAGALIDLLVKQAAVLDRLPNKHELKNKLIHDLLHGPSQDETAIMREAQILGMDLSPPRLVILIEAADFILGPVERRPSDLSDARVRHRAQLVISTIVDFFELPTDTICAYIGHGEVAVLKASNKKNLGRWVNDAAEQDQNNPSWANLQAAKRAAAALLGRLHSNTGGAITIGIGRHHPGLQGLALSYQDARAALSLGRRFNGRGRVHCLDGLGIAAFVGIADEQTKVDLARYLLSPLDHEAELMATVESFFANNCVPSAAAAALSIHRNTLSYRLDKIASLTGLDPRQFDDAVQIHLALTLRSLAADPYSNEADKGDIEVERRPVALADRRMPPTHVVHEDARGIS